MRRENITVTIEKIVPGGDGLGRFEGRVVFVPFTAPGDVVLVKPRTVKKQFIKGDMVKLIEPSPMRILPRCKHFTRCGGCNYQHIGYEDQLVLKREHVVDALTRIGKLSLSFAPEIVASQPWAYRNRVRFQVGAKGTQFFAGFHQAQSHIVEPVGECPILIPELETLIHKRDWSISDTPDKRFFGLEGSVYDSEKIFSTTVKEKEVFLSNAVFFQSNLSLLPDLIDYALAGEAGDTAMDLFSGVGLFSLFLQETFKKVIAVEINTRCQDIARRHLKDSVERFYDPVEIWVNSNRHTNVDLLLIDPPRTGIDKSALEQLMAINAQRIVYVSCDPVTMARDLQKLSAEKYEITAMKAFDMFPQTSHIEVVTKLRRREG